MKKEEKIWHRTCRTCGGKYEMKLNPKFDFKKAPYELKYINTDGKNTYYANSPLSCCPTCVARGVKAETTY